MSTITMQNPCDYSKASPDAFAQDRTLVAVVEMSLNSWLVAGLVPGIGRDPRKKLDPDPEEVLKLLYRWRDEAIQAGKEVERIAVAYETGRDSFWLARWLRERGIDAYVIHSNSVTVSREHRRAKTDRIDTEMLKRGFLGWLRGEPGHCSMAAIPTVEEEDARRPHREREVLVHERTRLVNQMKSVMIQYGVRGFNPALRRASKKLDAVRTPEGIPLPPYAVAMLRRHMERLRVVDAQIEAIEQERRRRLESDPADKRNAMVLRLMRIVGLGQETAEQLVHEMLFRKLRDRRSVARYAGLTGSPDESGSKRRERGLARAGNARVRKLMIQLCWRLVRFQPDLDLVRWYQRRTADANRARKTFIVAFARKLIIALWRYVNTGVVPEGMKLHPSAQAAVA